VKLNHKAIQTVIRVVGLGIFLVTISIKLRNLVLFGGTKIIRESDETIDGEEDAEDTYEEPEPVEGYDEPAKMSSASPTGAASSG